MAERAARKEFLDKRAREFFDASRYLKFLLSPADMGKLGSSRMKLVEEKTSTMIQWSPKGDYYPWDHPGANGSLTARPRKVVIIAGKERAVLNAFKLVRGIVAKSAENPIPFIVPNSAVGSLIGPSGKKINQKEEVLHATISVRSTPMAESQIVAFSNVSETQEETARWLLKEQKDYVGAMRDTLTLRYQHHASGMKTEIYVPLSDSQARQFIGKRGEVLRRFQDVFKILIDTKRHEVRGPTGTTMVKMEGLFGDVHAAHEELMRRFIYLKK